MKIGLPIESARQCAKRPRTFELRQIDGRQQRREIGVLGRRERSTRTLEAVTKSLEHASRALLNDLDEALRYGQVCRRRPFGCAWRVGHGSIIAELRSVG